MQQGKHSIVCVSLLQYSNFNHEGTTRQIQNVEKTFYKTAGLGSLKKKQCGKTETKRHAILL